MRPIAALLGPTASGKSELALELAGRAGAHIVSVDSMQVYRGMDIGTAKPSPDDRRRVPHHLVDIADPGEDFSVAEFQAAGRRIVDRLLREDVPVLITGGSGLHFRALVDPLAFPPTDPETRAELEALDAAAARERLLAADPEAGTVVDLANPRRVTRALEIFALTDLTPSQRAQQPEAEAVASYRAHYPLVAAGVDPGEPLAARIARRVDAMIDVGLLVEVASLAGHLGPTARQAVGYKELLPVVAGELSVEEGREAVVASTRALAKRQRTWFRRDPRIDWVAWHPDGGERLAAVTARFEEASWTS